MKYPGMLKWSEELELAMNARDDSRASLAIEQLEYSYKSEFEPQDDYESLFVYLTMIKASVRFFSFYNFRERVHYLCNQALEIGEGCDYISMSQEEHKKIEDLLQAIQQIKKNTKRSTSLVINRPDCQCALCRARIANDIGSHMWPNFIAHPTFSYDQKGKRDHEALDHLCINNPTWNGSYYGRDVPDDRIKKTHGDSMTDEEAEENVNRLVFDNMFCTICEARFGILETAYSAYYNHQKQDVHPQIAYLLWLSILWRVSLGRMGIYIKSEDDFELRELLDMAILKSENEICQSQLDLGHWKYAVFRGESEVKQYDKGIFACRYEYPPYAIMANDIVVVFYPHEPKDEQLVLGPIEVKRENLNDWHAKEKICAVDRRWFLGVRDWMVSTTYDCFDPEREQLLLDIRENERSSGQIVPVEEVERIIAQKRKYPKPPKRHYFRKNWLMEFAAMQQFAYALDGKAYDPLQDDLLCLNEQDFMNYYEDMSVAARAGEDVRGMPFYREARKAIPNPKMWRDKSKKKRK